MAPETVGLILAGGQSRRMGQPKADIRLGEKSLIRHVADKLGPQVACIAFSLGNNDLPDISESFHQLDDGSFSSQGPLAGILAGLNWAQSKGFNWLVCAPVDTPFLPFDFVSRLHAAKGNAPLVFAASRGRTHPTLSLWSVSLAKQLERHLLQTSERSVMRFAQTVSCSTGTFDLCKGDVDPFFNINTPEDLEQAKRHVP